MSKLNECERSEWTVLGRMIGTATGWDQADTFVIALYDFQPAKGVALPAGILTIDFANGTAETFDDNGVVLVSKDIVAAVAHMPIVEASE